MDSGEIRYYLITCRDQGDVCGSELRDVVAGSKCVLAVLVTYGWYRFQFHDLCVDNDNIHSSVPNKMPLEIQSPFLKKTKLPAFKFVNTFKGNDDTNVYFKGVDLVENGGL